MPLFAGVHVGTLRLISIVSLTMEIRQLFLSTVIDVPVVLVLVLMSCEWRGRRES